MTKPYNSPLRLELPPKQVPKPKRAELPCWKAAYKEGTRAQREAARLVRESEAVSLDQLIRHKCIITVAYGHTHELQEPGCSWFRHLIGGRAVYLEVKHSNSQSLGLKCFSKHQLTELERTSNNGACTVVTVVVCEQPQLTFCAVSWRVVIAAMAARTRESLSLGELKPWAVSMLLLALRAFCKENTR